MNDPGTPYTIKRIILASKSPYRRALLEAFGLDVEALDAQVNEGAVVASTPRDTALARARAKALAASQKVSGNSLILGADQVVGFKGQILDKSPSAAHARRRIEELQGQVHTLHSAMCLVVVTQKGSVSNNIISWCVDVPMAMRSLSPVEMDAYIATGEWEGSVGGYKYERCGAQLFDLENSLGADQSAIIGLPLPSLGAKLRKLGINPLTHPKGPWLVDFI